MQEKEIFRLRFSNYEELSDIAAHSEIELLYVLDGTVDIQVENKLSHMEKDDILVINPDRRRNIQFADKPLIMHLMIDYTMVRDYYQGQDILFWCDSTGSDHEKYSELRLLLKRLIRKYTQSENYDTTFSFLSDCYEILARLTFDFMVKAADVQWSEEGDRFEERLYKINNYINTNYDQPISIKDLSEKLYLSIGYLSRFFKKNYGMNFANYLTNVRLVHATDELLYTNISVTRVAYDCGFTSAAIFNKAFKKAYDVTPTEFRKQAEKAEKKHVDLSDQEELENRLEKIVIENETDTASGVEFYTKTIKEGYSVSQTQVLHNYWGDTINFGEASNLLNSAIREHLSLLQETLHFRYVRFWSIFSRDMSIRPDQDHYDFSRIDSILDFVLELDLKPFIEFGMKPKTIHYEIGNSNKELMGDDYTDEQWKKLLTLFMRHLEKRYGQKELNGWRMELWFDEDLRPDLSEWDKYIEKFSITYQIVKSCNEKIQLGGYGIRIDHGGEARMELMRIWKEKAPLPDFVSIMLYGYERGADGMDIHSRRSTDDELFLHMIRNEKKRLEKVGWDHLPIYICEWNLTPSVRNMINDTCYKGAYIIRNILDLYGEVRSMGYGAGSDRQYTSYDTSEMLFGGTGLISKEGIKKPAAFALSFMNGLYHQLIGINRNYIITTDGYNNYNIVCHNQQKLNDNYYLTPETQIQKNAVWKYFDNIHELKLQLVLNDMQEGTYKVNTFRVNRHFGSILNIWEGTSYEDELSRDEIRYLKKICEPYISIRKEETDQGSIMIQEKLEANEFLCITIKHV